MPTLEERVASLEAKVETMSDLRSVIGELRADMNRQFGELRGDMNARFVLIEHRFTDVDGRIGLLDAKVDRQFLWLMGMMLTGFTAVIAALIGVVYR